MKNLCSHVRKSYLGIKKLNLKNKKLRKLRKLRNLHCISFTVFRKNCTALSQSELRNFFLYIINMDTF